MQQIVDILDFDYVRPNSGFLIIKPKFRFIIHIKFNINMPVKILIFNLHLISLKSNFFQIKLGSYSHRFLHFKMKFYLLQYNYVILINYILIKLIFNNLENNKISFCNANLRKTN